VGFLAFFLLTVVDLTASWLGPALFTFPFVLGGGILLYSLMCTRPGAAPNERVSERAPGKPEEGGPLRSGERSAEPADSTPRRRPRRRIRPVRGVTSGGILVGGTASALFVLFVFGGLGRPVAVAFLIMVGVTLVAALALELRRAVREARGEARDAEEPVFPLPPEYNAFVPLALGCVLTIAAILSGGLFGMGPGALAGLGAGAAFFAPITLYTLGSSRRKRRWLRATVEGKFERWQRPNGKLARLEKRSRPGFSVILLKALLLSVVFVLPALYMIFGVFSGGIPDAFGGIALSAFVVPFPVAYVIHKSIHDPE
jgi:hypothetical protein